MLPFFVFDAKFNFKSYYFGSDCENFSYIRIQVEFNLLSI